MTTPIRKTRHQRADILRRISGELSSISIALVGVEESLFQGRNPVNTADRHGREIQDMDLVQQSLFSLTLMLTNLSGQESRGEQLDLVAACRDIPLMDMAMRITASQPRQASTGPRRNGEVELF